MMCLVISLLSVTLALTDAAIPQELYTATKILTAPVYKEILNHENGNFVFSPFSSPLDILLLQYGCKGETAEEIRTCLHLSNDTNKVNRVIRKTLRPILTQYSSIKLDAAHKIYVKENLEIKDKFDSVAAEVFKADAENIDLSKKSNATVIINHWVEKQTSNKIHNLVNSDIFDGHTKGILISALYFQGNVSDSFNARNTKKKEFYRTTEEGVPVDTMLCYHGSFKYYECSKLNAKFLEIPFDLDNNISITIILPNEKDGLAALENQIERVLVDHDLTLQNLAVALPKLKIESKIDLKNFLQKLGINKVFDLHEADLSRISGEKGDLVIDDVVHKTFIEVGEAEPQPVKISLSVFPSIDQLNNLKEVVVDHPFIFYIKIKDVIICVGRVLMPSQ